MIRERIKRLSMLKQMKLLIVILAFLAVSFVGYAQTLRPEVDVLAIEYPPFTSEQLADFGVSFNKLNLLIGQEFSIRPIFLPPARAQLTVNGEEWCLSFYPRSKDESDSQQFRLFEDEVKLTLITRRDSLLTSWNDLAELAGKSIAVLRVQAQNPFLDQFTSAGIELVYVESTEIAMQMVIKGRTDFAMGDSVSLGYFQQQNSVYESLTMSDTVIKTTRLMIEANPTCQYFDKLKGLISPK